jgi:membrane protease YdiL (CAAX protease family)
MAVAVIRPRTARFYFTWAAAALVGVAMADLGAGFSLPGTAGGAVSALLALILWWWRRRKNRLRALRLFGAKSRARLAALVRSMPRPSPRLVPERVPA